jgi:hypothetical protein
MHLGQLLNTERPATAAAEGQQSRGMQHKRQAADEHMQAIDDKQQGKLALVCLHLREKAETSDRRPLPWRCEVADPKALKSRMARL